MSHTVNPRIQARPRIQAGESDLIVLIEAVPRIEAGFQKLAEVVSLLSERLCTVYRAKQRLHVACHQFAVTRMY